MTITVSRCIAVSSEISGVPWKNDGHFLGSSTSDSSHRRSSTCAQREPGVISAHGGSLIVQSPSSFSSRHSTTVWKTGTPAARAALEQARGVDGRPLDQLGAAEDEVGIGERVLEVDHEHRRPLAGLDARLAVAAATQGSSGSSSSPIASPSLVVPCLTRAGRTRRGGSTTGRAASAGSPRASPPTPPGARAR